MEHHGIGGRILHDHPLSDRHVGVAQQATDRVRIYLLFLENSFHFGLSIGDSFFELFVRSLENSFHFGLSTGIHFFNLVFKNTFSEQDVCVTKSRWWGHHAIGRLFTHASNIENQERTRVWVRRLVESKHCL